MSRKKTIETRQAKIRANLLAQLERTPIIELACEKAGISRTTFYRWIDVSKTFAREVEKAMDTGRDFINDLSESQLVSLIRQGNIAAIRLWLQHNSARYANKLELSGSVGVKADPMTAEQKAVVRLALKRSSLKINEKKPTKKKPR